MCTVVRETRTVDPFDPAAIATPAAPLAQPAAPVLVDQPHPVRLLPGFWQVGGGYLSHDRDAASYLLVDERTGAGILVDCGSHSGLAALRANIQQITALDRIKLVIGTHGHWDHIEAYGHLRDEMRAPIALHARDADAVERGDPDLTCAGWLYNEPFHTFPIDIRLHGGERYLVGGYALEILHLPGHSPGSIGIRAVYERTGQSILIPGDAIQGAYGRRIHSSLSAWKRSLRRLMQDPPDLLVPNHLPAGAQTLNTLLQSVF